MTGQQTAAPSVSAAATVVRSESCEHGGRWVVDVPTRRVIKRPCAECTPAAASAAPGDPGSAAA